MVKPELDKTEKISASLVRVIDCVDKKNSFILEAGAGSGKTRSLIETLKYILKNEDVILRKNNQQIVCITFTNVAKNEIAERIENNPLVFVGTIHQFLWKTIKNFQKELIVEILEFNSQYEKHKIENLEEIIQNKIIDYSDYGRKFEDGQITHEDVINFSNKLFVKYPKILKITSDKYPYIFVDEYQDTEEKTVTMLLDYLLESRKGDIVIGFFGDSMQHIYDAGIGNIPEKYKTNGILNFITKEENFRCSKEVIKLLNNIRDNIKQIPSGDNLEGSALFVDCNGSGDVNDYEKLKEFLVTNNGWNIKNTKILSLTHKDIAKKAGYENLLNVYNENLTFGRERLFKKEDAISDFIINKLETFVDLYKNKKYGEFINMLGKQGFIVKKQEDKHTIETLMVELIKLRDKSSVKVVLDYAFRNHLLVKPQRMIDFERKIQEIPLPEKMEKKKSFYDELMEINYREFIYANDFIEDHTPYSTDHGVKGAEYNNVLMVIDDGSWFKYKFNDVFANNKSNLKRFNETLNLLYVCCSRARDNLAIIALSKLDDTAISGIKTIFGNKNYITIDKI
jgi:DNA helicase-2/ATP-dependent DNA helicase PcrA